MKKVIVIGCPGSGKSTFSKALAAQTGLPLYHLDMLFWKPDGPTVEKSVVRAKLRDILALDTWIIDGNYASTMEERMAACDTVFFLDLPTDVCLAGIAARKGKPRTDLPWVETSDTEDAEFLRFVREYRENSGPRVVELLNALDGKEIIFFRSREEILAYLNRFS